MNEQNITINNRIYDFEEGETILTVAWRNNIFVPTLCFLEGLSVSGSCRLCVVDVDGITGPVIACATPAVAGMSVTTENANLQAYRRNMLAMLFAAGHHICAACIANGHCELQALAQQVGVHAIHFPHRTPVAPVDVSHANFGYDPNRCILCMRCVRACAEIEGAGIWQLMGRGAQSRVSPNMGQPWGAAAHCTACGKCVHACPTGALFDKSHSTGQMDKHPELIAQLVTDREKKR
jgi:bidirectional [NiFe] hydrogenase diaphorase subunit